MEKKSEGSRLAVVAEPWNLAYMSASYLIFSMVFTVLTGCKLWIFLQHCCWVPWSKDDFENLYQVACSLGWEKMYAKRTHA